MKLSYSRLQLQKQISDVRFLVASKSKQVPHT